MDIRLEPKQLAEVDSDALVIVGFEGSPPASAAAGPVKELYDSGEFSGKALEIAILHRPAGLKAKRLVLAGGGKRDKFRCRRTSQTYGRRGPLAQEQRHP